MMLPYHGVGRWMRKWYYFSRQGGRCYICGGQMRMTCANTEPDYATEDHLKSRYHGGTTEQNILLAHSKCNSKKNMRPADDECREWGKKLWQEWCGVESALNRSGETSRLRSMYSAPQPQALTGGTKESCSPDGKSPGAGESI